MKKILILSCLVFGLISFTCFAATQTNFINETVFQDDFFAAGQNISNISVVQGDMISLGETISNTGTVNGDFLGAATKVYLNGKLLDDVRTMGQDIKIDAQIGKNVNVLGKTTEIGKGTYIKGDLRAAGGELKVDGAINGATYIVCNKVALNGTFNGDVYIRIIGDFTKDINPITIGPNAKIKGNLTYTSPIEAAIANGAQIGNVQKSIVAPTNRVQNTSDVNGYAFVRSFVSALLYSLIGLLVIRLFPNFVNKSREAFKTHTLKCFGLGVLGALSMILSSILTIVLFVAIIFISPAFALTYMMVSTGFYAALFYLSTIPAALIIGDMVIKAENKVFYKLTLGVIAVSFVILFLDYLSQATAYGTMFSIINTFLVLFISLTGFGSLLKAIKKVYKGEEAQL